MKSKSSFHAYLNVMYNMSEERTVKRWLVNVLSTVTASCGLSKLGEENGPENNRMSKQKITMIETLF